MHLTHDVRPETSLDAADETRRVSRLGAATVLGEYRIAKARHADVRLVAYDETRRDAIMSASLSPDVHLRDVDEHALIVWRTTWGGRKHPSGAGGWEWPSLIAHLPRRAAVLPLAIWHGEDLCGLARGYCSRARGCGARHTIVLTHAERRPEPPPVALRGYVIPLAIAAARNYGLAVGASRLRLMYPDPKLLWYYQRLGFAVAWSGGRAVYCEREIQS